MNRIADDVIGGFNNFLQEQQDSGPDARITLVQFNSQEPQNVVLSGAPIMEAQPLSRQVYKPRGGTPLLDATGQLIERARIEERLRSQNGLPPENILFVSITDGAENDSHIFSGDRIRSMIKECESHGWTFVFLSADLDTYAGARLLGVKQGSTQAFSADSEGVHTAMYSISMKTREFRDKKRTGLAAEKDDFFGVDKPAEEIRRRKDRS